ncbi:DoxX family protein [Sphingobacterium haloxyli]|uniref:DoxX-like family protein n=1 Tax=Sphingobacterium haloxyli TaxID=2100533 RepID=A0A2S9J731_9SPHI|nr:DoxX family protein [Sphingobacterium haloxyli]PRD48560.1 DoxX-like family protein [Sphingobacterium haloxyli]
MKRKNRIIYWIATVWLSLGMVSTGIVQLIRMEEEVEKMTEMGYPAYFLTIIGVWKILGVMVVLLPKLPLIKEWAYAGFFFLMTGAIFTHIAVGDGAMEYVGPSLLLVLTIISWYFRPNERKLVIAKNED